MKKNKNKQEEESDDNGNYTLIIVSILIWMMIILINLYIKKIIISIDNLISDNEMDEIDLDDPFFAEAEKELEESEEFKKGKY